MLIIYLYFDTYMTYIIYIYHMDLRMLLHHVFLARRDASANAPQGSQGCIERVRIPQGCHNGARVFGRALGSAKTAGIGRVLKRISRYISAMLHSHLHFGCLDILPLRSLQGEWLYYSFMSFTYGIIFQATVELPCGAEGEVRIHHSQQVAI